MGGGYDPHHSRLHPNWVMKGRLGIFKNEPVVKHPQLTLCRESEWTPTPKVPSYFSLGDFVGLDVVEDFTEALCKSTILERPCVHILGLRLRGRAQAKYILSALRSSQGAPRYPYDPR